VLKTEPVTLTTELPGRISAMETSDVRPQVAGVIRKRLFEEGSIVHQGQILYLIEDAGYRASVLNAQGQLATAQATIRSTALQSDRYRQLAAANAISKQDADNADASAQQARAQVVTAQGSLRSALVNLGFTRVRAPITGRIGRSLFTPGALVSNGQTDPLATIQRLDTVYVDVSQSAAQLLDLKAALSGGGVSRQGPDSVRVQLLLPNGQAYPIEGKLKFAEVTVDQNSGTVTLRATFPNPDGLLMPGLFVRARIVEGVEEQGLLAPQTGISRNERGQATALVLGPDNIVQPRVVTTRQTVGDKWLVTGGLKPGDRLITEGLVGIMPGIKVTPHPAGSAPPASAPGAAGSQPGQGPR
jgi:membrane fusion protein (multidrug efflux system)